MKRDSVDKIVYKGDTYPVKRLIVSPLIVRGYTCPEGCGGCCGRFSLDYLPPEKHPYDHGASRELVLGGEEEREGFFA